MADVNTGRRSRAERARQTRSKMTRAAYELFVARGYPATTMADIAARADVAVQTLYFSFGTKAQLLQHAYTYAVLGDSNDLPPQQQPWYTAMSEADDLGQALRILVDNVAAVLARTAPLDEFVRAASFEPEPAQVRAVNEARRRQAWQDMVRRLHSRFDLKHGLEPDRATDILMLLMSPTTYQTLVGEYGWTPGEWRTWCIDCITAQLFQT